MFAARYFNPRYWAARFFPKVGEDLVAGAECVLALTTSLSDAAITRTAALSDAAVTVTSAISDTLTLTGTISPTLTFETELC